MKEVEGKLTYKTVDITEHATQLELEDDVTCRTNSLPKEDFCAECNEKCIDEELQCYICHMTAHYKCYTLEYTRKPVSDDQYQLVKHGTVNFKWFCNECTQQVEVSKDKRLESPRTCKKSGELSVIVNKLWQSENKSTQVHSPNLETSGLAEPLASINKDSKVAIVDANILDTLEHQSDILTEYQQSLKNMESEFNSIKVHLSKSHMTNNEITENIRAIQRSLMDNQDMLKSFSEQPNVAGQAKNNISYRDAISKAHTHNAKEKQTFEYQPVNTSVNPDCTVLVLKVGDRKLLNSSSNIKREFNKYYKNIHIKTCFVSKSGTVFIELNREEDACEVYEKWDGKYFQSQTNDHQPTICRRLSDMNKSAIIRNIPLHISDNDISIAISEELPGAIAKRFIKKDGYKLKTVKVDLCTVKDQQRFIKTGFRLENEVYKTVEEFKPRRRIIQCYNCFKFGHVAKLCRQVHQSCKTCSENHHYTQCKSLVEKCCNCEAPHSAADKRCPIFQNSVHIMKLNEKTMYTYKTSSNKTLNNNINIDFANEY